MKAIKKFVLLVICIFLMFSGANVPVYAVTVETPAKVMGVKVVSKTTRSIKLTWKKAARAKGYQVFRKTSGSTWKKIASIKGASKKTYICKKLKAGKKYQFKIRAYTTFKSKGKTKYRFGKYSSVVSAVAKGDGVTYNKVVFKSKYAEVKLLNINSKGINFRVKNLLKNRSIDINMQSIALDGYYTDLNNYYQNIIEPGESMKICMEGTLKYYNHQKLSLYADLTVNDSGAWEAIDIADFSIGGSRHLEEKVPKGKELYNSETLKVNLVEINNDGPLLWVVNKRSSVAPVMMKTFKINGKEFEGNYVWMFPGKSSSYYQIDAAYYEPDITAKTIKSWKANMGLMNEEEEFTVGS